MPYDAGYLAGFRCEEPCGDALGRIRSAKHRMRPTIESSICADIGGDHQRIGSMHTAYDRDIHIPLPVWWVSVQVSPARVYRALINGAGELVGDRPTAAGRSRGWSWPA